MRAILKLKDQNPKPFTGVAIRFIEEGRDKQMLQVTDEIAPKVEIVRSYADLADKRKWVTKICFSNEVFESVEWIIESQQTQNKQSA